MNKWGLCELPHKNCRTPLYEECPKHHGHKGDPGVTLGTCGAIGGMGPNDPSVGEGLGHWERLLPTETRRHEDKAMSYA